MTVRTTVPVSIWRSQLRALIGADQWHGLILKDLGVVNYSYALDWAGNEVVELEFGSEQALILYRLKY